MIKRQRNVMMLFTLELLILLVINVNTISGIVNSSCTFENGQCGWSANGFVRYKWKLQRGRTSHSSTGPDKDHTTSSDANQYILENGYYFCTVSHSNSTENDVSDLHSGLINQCPKQFLTFWYHMNGRNINTLKVFQVKNARLIELWRTAANQGNNWQFQSLSLEDIGPYQIMFRATRGTGIKSEIAVDDIFINNTECKKDLVVGLVIGGLLLLCVITVIVVLIKRQSLKSRPRETIKNNSGEYDYIESHDLAFPLTANHSSHIPNDGTHSNTAYPGRRNTTLSDNPTLSDQTYSIVDQTPESTLNKTRDDGKGTTDSYMVLDPTATGFNRTTLPNTRSDCEFAKPVIVTGNSIGDEDQYALSEEGCYDHSGNNRHKELEVNIYNHAVDTIYDSGSHTRKEAGRDDTYDHFLGQKKEDGNDI